MEKMNRKNKSLFKVEKISGVLATTAVILLMAASCNEKKDDVQETEVTLQETSENELNEEVANTDNAYLNQWDENGDRQWDIDEFGAVMANEGLYEDLDSDGNEILAENEFHDSFFDEFDGNKDEILNNDEYEALRGEEGTYFGEPFDAWDTNNDSQLDRDEFNSRLSETDLLKSWDADGNASINKEEYAQGRFDYYDLDDDGRLNEREIDPTNLYISDSVDNQ